MYLHPAEPEVLRARQEGDAERAKGSLQRPQLGQVVHRQQRPIAHDGALLALAQLPERFEDQPCGQVRIERCGMHELAEGAVENFLRREEVEGNMREDS